MNQDQEPEEPFDPLGAIFMLVSAALVAFVMVASSGCASFGKSPIYECQRACKTGTLQSFTNEELACQCR